MAEDHVRTFNQARRQLVEQRRVVIKSLGGTFQRELTEAHIDLVIRIQNALDVIDRAIEEERREAQAQPA